MLRIKNGKVIDSSDNIYHEEPRSILQYSSNKEKHKAEDIVDPAEPNISEARPNNKSSTFRLTNGNLADFNSSFENDPDPEIEKIDQDYCENKQEYKIKEENEVGKNEKGKGHIAEDVGHVMDPEESPGEDPDSATAAAAVMKPCAEEAAQANSETDVPVQLRNGGPQV